MALLAFEVLAVVAIALAWPHLAWAELLPFSLPLLVVASLFRWTRKRSWGEVAHGGRLYAIGGVLAGALGLGLALVIGTPLVEAVSNHAVEWNQHGAVRGEATQLAAFLVFVTFAAIAAELALRGWIVERALELSAPPALAVLAGALAEAALTPGGVGVRAGAALFGAGLGWMYVAGGRSVIAPLCARLAFSLGALLLDGLRWI